MMINKLFKNIESEISSKWDKIGRLLTYSFQPIVNIHSGCVYGFEALLRGWENSGYTTINDLFNSAYLDKTLYSFDVFLRELAIKKFSDIPNAKELKLFYNLDNRILEMDDYLPYNTDRILNKYSLTRSNLTFEISEKYQFSSYNDTRSLLESYKAQNYCIALDDFGAGYSGLTLLYHSDPDIIKIDRFFIENLNKDSHKRFFVSSIVKMAHMMGSKVVAEGVETSEEFYVCREIGCDFIQGYLIQKPQIDLKMLDSKYYIIDTLVRTQKRMEKNDIYIIKKHMINPAPFKLSVQAEEILQRFKEETYQLFPVVNELGEPIGLINGKSMKKYVYSIYGIPLLQNAINNEGIFSLITSAPVVDLNTPVSEIIDLHAVCEKTEGVLLALNGLYSGILDSTGLLKIIGEKQIAFAQEQNPLTHLPGNFQIFEYITKSLNNNSTGYYFVYFDFNNFKPFNDLYGFRQGDRIIQLFADILKEYCIIQKDFIGHIGGDDFFAGYRADKCSIEAIKNELLEIINRFENNVLPFYKNEDRIIGHIKSKNRDGEIKIYPLLSVSAAMMHIHAGSSCNEVDMISGLFAKLKKKAKKNINNIAVGNIK